MSWEAIVQLAVVGLMIGAGVAGWQLNAAFEERNRDRERKREQNRNDTF